MSWTELQNERSISWDHIRVFINSHPQERQGNDLSHVIDGRSGHCSSWTTLTNSQEERLDVVYLRREDVARWWWHIWWNLREIRAIVTLGSAQSGWGGCIWVRTKFWGEDTLVPYIICGTLCFLKHSAADICTNVDEYSIISTAVVASLFRTDQKKLFD